MARAGRLQSVGPSARLPLMSKKITELDAITTLAADDILVLVDDDVTTTKKKTVENFLDFIPLNRSDDKFGSI